MKSFYPMIVNDTSEKQKNKASSANFLDLSLILVRNFNNFRHPKSN